MNLEVAYLFTLSLAGIILILAAINDVKKYKIPNLISIALLILFPFYVYVAPITIDWLNHLMVLGVVLIVGYLGYLRNWIGAGDVKLLAAISLWAGPSHIIPLIFITTLVGGILGIGLGLFTLVKQRSTLDKKSLETLTKKPIPYGLAIAIGGLCTLVLLSHPDLLQAKG